MSRFLVLLVRGYRLLPARRAWSGGCSTSHLALAELPLRSGLAALLMVARMAVPRAQWRDNKPSLIWLPPAPGD